MNVHIQLGESFAVRGEITATWPARVTMWLAVVALGIMAVHALAASDVTDTKPTVQLWGQR